MGQSSKTLWRKVRYPFNRWTAFTRLERFHARARSLDEIVDRALDFGTAGFFRVRTTQKRSEIARLAAAVDALRPRIILEIGTEKGGTLFIWSHLALEKVITCDINDMHVQREFYEAFPPPGSHCKVRVISGDSHSHEVRMKIGEELGGDKVDFLFIDGDHTKGGVAADFYEYGRMVRSGGMIALHDIAQSQPCPTIQVYVLWKELREQLTVEEYLEDPNQCGFGIGVVRVP